MQRQEDMVEPPDEGKQSLLEKAHAFGHFGAEAITKSLHNEGYNGTQFIKMQQNRKKVT